MSAALLASVERKLTVVQGEYRVSADCNVVLSTLLGSCVAVCLRDPVTGVGGMNHFLVPGTEHADASSLRYGSGAMDLLVGALLAQGAKRSRLQAKLFGGARMLAGLTDLGARNADFAEHYLRRERIAQIGGSLRGQRGRRVEFWPASGRSRQIWVGPELGPVTGEQPSDADFMDLVQ